MHVRSAVMKIKRSENWPLGMRHPKHLICYSDAFFHFIWISHIFWEQKDIFVEMIIMLREYWKSIFKVHTLSMRTDTERICKNWEKEYAMYLLVIWHSVADARTCKIENNMKWLFIVKDVRWKANKRKWKYEQMNTSKNHLIFICENLCSANNALVKPNLNEAWEFFARMDLQNFIWSARSSDSSQKW